MPELTPEAKKQLEEQKEKCIFCKIVKGEMASKKVFEDEKVIAVLDINPASAGHVLVMPKEHYPIMPYIPPEEFTHLFKTTKQLVVKIQEAMVTDSCNVFIANGWAAGQQAAHFMLHIIPREKNDGMFLFNLTKGDVDKTKLEEAHQLLSNNLPVMMENHFKKVPAEWHKAKTAGQMMRKLTKEQVIKIIDQNPQIKQVIEKNPNMLIEQIKVNEQLKTLFKDVDVNEVIKHFNPKFEPTVEAEFEEKEEVGEEPETEEAKEETEEEKEEGEETETEEAEGEEESEDVMEALGGKQEAEGEKEEGEKKKKKLEKDIDLDTISGLFR